MKGVILGLAPHVQLVDLCHEVTPFASDEAAFLVAEALPYFPDGTIHLVVVDPGVGSGRRALAAAGKRHRFIGPDNGVLGPLLHLDGPATVHEVRPSAPGLGALSKTFHGRDLFAPVAARVALGEEITHFGPIITENLGQPFPQPEHTPDGWVGQVVHVDRFGTLISNIGTDHEAELVGVEVGNRMIPFVNRYGDVDPGSLGALVGSSERVEVFVREGSAAERLKLGRGAPVIGRTR